MGAFREFEKNENWDGVTYALYTWRKQNGTYCPYNIAQLTHHVHVSIAHKSYQMRPNEFRSVEYSFWCISHQVFWVQIWVHVSPSTQNMEELGEGFMRWYRQYYRMEFTIFIRKPQHGNRITIPSTLVSTVAMNNFTNICRRHSFRRPYYTELSMEWVSTIEDRVYNIPFIHIVGNFAIWFSRLAKRQKGNIGYTPKFTDFFSAQIWGHLWKSGYGYSNSLGIWKS